MNNSLYGFASELMRSTQLSYVSWGNGLSIAMFKIKDWFIASTVFFENVKHIPCLTCLYPLC